MSEGIAALDVTALLEAYRTGALSPTEAVTDALQRLDGAGRSVNAVLTLTADEALAAAARSTERWRTGTAGPLEGIPFGAKDIMATAGVRTTGGSQIFGGLVPSHDAAAVARLRGAGAVLVAKLQTFAFANGDPVNRDFGPTRNPHDPDRIAGGSSSGSAAAVAAGAVPLALGSDTGGSIRLPAAYCGISGLKPTFGRVSRHGVMPLSWTLDHVGPMTRSARDLRPVLGVLAGPDPRDPSTTPAAGFADVATPGPAAGRGLRVGVPDSYFRQECDDVTLQAFEAALDRLAGCGLEVVPVPLVAPELEDGGGLELMQAIGRTIITAEMASLHQSLRERNAEYDDMIGPRILAGESITAVSYLQALRLRHVVQLAFERALADVDVLVTPTTPTVAPPLATLRVATPDGAEVDWLEVAARNTFPANLTGMPAVSVPVPVGGPAGGLRLPVGLQVMAGPYRDDLVLAVAEVFESG